MTFPIKKEKYITIQRFSRTHYQLVVQLVEVKQNFLKNLTYKYNTLTRELNARVFPLLLS